MIVILVIELVKQRFGAYSDNGTCNTFCNIRVCYFVKLGEIDLTACLDRILLVCCFSVPDYIACQILGGFYSDA